MKSINRCLAVFAAGAVSLGSITFTGFAEQNGKSSDIVILYTNDVHCDIDSNIGYDGLALYKCEMETMYDSVILVDAGDALQGSPVGSLSKGKIHHGDHERRRI